MENYEQKIKEVIKFLISDEAKLKTLAQLMPLLKPVDNSKALEILCNYGVSYCERLFKPELGTQFCITRAKIFIMRPGNYIHEMKNITLAPNWFGFALESLKNRYTELDKQVKNLWGNAQADISKSLKLVNQKPVAGAVAFCYKTIGEIYGQYYLQLRLYSFRSKSSFRSRLANIYFFRWLRVDDYFVLDRGSIRKLQEVRKDCLAKLNTAVKIFKTQKNYDYLADAYLALAVEHEGFNNLIRSKIYLYLAERLIIRYKIQELLPNLAVCKRRR